MSTGTLSCKNIITLNTLNTPAVKKPNVLVAWSGGKDCALALHEIIKTEKFNVAGLFTTISEKFRRVNLSGIREDLIRKQARSIGLPLEIAVINGSRQEDYEAVLDALYKNAKSQGIDAVAYGDIFDGSPGDLICSRAKQLEKHNMKLLLPLTGSTLELVQKNIDTGFQSIVVALDKRKLGKKFVGRVLDREFLEKLPKDIDPCGELGEYHTYTFAGPVFRENINIKKGKVHEIGDNYFCELVGL